MTIFTFSSSTSSSSSGSPVNDMLSPKYTRYFVGSGSWPPGMNTCGITGTPENCRRLLGSEEAVLVFPEGARGISKPFSKRYQLADFGKGFLRLALEMQAPIVPVAVVGAEEQAPAVNVKPLAKLLRTPSFPVVPYPPFVPLVPLPVKYRVYFGTPMTFTGDPDDDDTVLDEQVKQVKNAIQSMIHVGLQARKNVFW